MTLMAWVGVALAALLLARRIWIKRASRRRIELQELVRRRKEHYDNEALASMRREKP